MDAAAQRILDAVRELKPHITARAGEIEQARRMPPDLVAQLRAAGLFRALVPRSYGGHSIDAPSMVECLMELASADGATAWTMMIGCHAPLVFSLFPKKTFESIYRHSPDVIGGGSAAPRGVSERCNGGFNVSGRWTLASGCEHADYLFGVCCDTEGGTPVVTPNGQPPPRRYVVLSAASWQIIDAWNAAGLRGTGSHDIALTNVHVPTEQTVAFGKFGAEAQHDFQEPVFVASHLQKILHIAAVAVGIAEGALAEVTTVGRSGKKRAYSSHALADMPVFQHRLGRAEADVCAARAYLRDRARAYWQQALRLDVHPSLDIDILQAAAWIADTCTGAVDSCFRAGGAEAVYAQSPLQRRLRDIHTLVQHILVDESYFTGAGAARLGRPLGVPFARAK
jgi:alkylation response protein AidB-like acyl-CoA dehydrogenase